MYTIYVDDALLFSTGLEDEEHVLLSPKLSLDIGGAGSLAFTMKPGHALYDTIRKMKSIITVVQDGETIFRGRVMDDRKDFYNQKNVYCEGDRSFLLDSLCAPYSYSGTVKGLFQKLIDDHNAQVDTVKQFAVGNVDAVTDDETLDAENTAYWDTLKEIDAKLLGAYGGYLKTRTDGSTCFVDWVKLDGGTDGQTIEFSVNLLDLEDKNDATDVFTILIPLGASEIGEDGNYADPLTIASVNSGLEYIQDDERVAKYGKIWRTKTWGHIEDPAQLLKKGEEYLKTGIAVQTLTLKFIDMHFTDSSRKSVLPGDHPHILSNPHGLDITPICTKAEIELLEPEYSTYTFGEAPRTLTDNVVKTEEDVNGLSGGGGGGKSVQEELKDYIRWADIRADADEALIELLTGEVSKQGERLSKAEITLDGVNGQIVLMASKEEVDELGRRINSAEIEIDGANAEITSKVSKDGVISAINQTSESVTISASKINLEGYVTASELSALEADLASVTGGTFQASHLYTQNLTATNTVKLDGHTCEWKTLKVVKGVKLNTEQVSIPGANGITYVAIGGVTATTTTEELKFLGQKVD